MMAPWELTSLCARLGNGQNHYRSSSSQSRVETVGYSVNQRRGRRKTVMKTLLSEEELQAGVERMAAEVNREYGDRPLTIVGVMTGCIVLMADMIRLLKMPLRVGVVQASSYRDGTTSGELVINSDLMLDITGHDVIVIDDIFDTGKTMVKLLEVMRRLEPKSIRSGVLLLKHGRQEVEYKPDFVGFDIPDEFVVGYGLDYRDEYRNLPFLACLEEAEINAPQNHE